MPDEVVYFLCRTDRVRKKWLCWSAEPDTTIETNHLESGVCWDYWGTANRAVRLLTMEGIIQMAKIVKIPSARKLEIIGFGPLPRNRWRIVDGVAIVSRRLASR